jgi:hypothetical protein
LTPCLPLGASWTPAPIHPDIEIADDAARQMDTVSLLVQIYGSDDLFIQVSRFKMGPLPRHVQALSFLLTQEFRTMLASRLLAITDYNTDKDVRVHPELQFILIYLTRPSFAFSIITWSCSNCDSARLVCTSARSCYRTCPNHDASTPTSTRRYRLRHPQVLCFCVEPPLPPGVLLTRSYHNAETGEALLDTTIISPMFWPTLREDELTLPAPIQRFALLPVGHVPPTSTARSYLWLSPQLDGKLRKGVSGRQGFAQALLAACARYR